MSNDDKTTGLAPAVLPSKCDTTRVTCVCARVRATLTHVRQQTLRLRGVKTWLGSELDVLGRGDRVQSSVSGVAGADNVFTGQSDWLTRRCTCDTSSSVPYKLHTAEIETVLVRVRDTITAIVSPSFCRSVYVCQVCEGVRRVASKLYTSHVTSFRHVSMYGLAFSELLVRRCVMLGNLTDCGSWTREIGESVPFHFDGNGKR